MPNKMLIDASHPEETRVVVVRGNRIEEFDFESQDKKQLKGNIYLARVTRVEPSLQAAFVEYGGNRHGFLAFSEIHPDYYQIPVADRQALLRAEAQEAEDEEDEDGDGEDRQSRDRGRRGRRRGGKSRDRGERQARCGRSTRRLRRASEGGDNGDIVVEEIATPPRSSNTQPIHAEHPIVRSMPIRPAMTKVPPSSDEAENPTRAARRRSPPRSTRDVISEAVAADANRASRSEPSGDNDRGMLEEVQSSHPRRPRDRIGRRRRRAGRSAQPPQAGAPPVQDPGSHQAPADPAGAGRQGRARQQGRGAHHLSVAGRPLFGADAEHGARRRHFAQDHQRRRTASA